MESIFNSIGMWLSNIEKSYSVNPYIFGIIYLITVPPFWFSVYKVVDSLKKKSMEKVLLWSMSLALCILAPFIYVAIFGRNLPGWFWGVIIAVICLSAVSVLREIKKRRT
ncbi:MAG: hypothetical protein AB1633_00100 [Elusimicrobiota bacterium]